MKKFTLIVICAILAIAALAQAPQGISHQAVIRNAANELVINSPIGIKVSILQGSAAGTVVYSETHLPTSNANGLISFVIGQGAVESGVFAGIDWAVGPYFIKTEVDPTGGSTYTIEGISQMLSVPYALHSTTAKELTEPFVETDPIFTDWDKSEGITITESQILDLQSYLTNILGESIGDLSDVDLSGIAAGKIIKYDAVLEKWVIADDLGITVETDPIFTDWDKSTGITITESQILDLKNYLTNILGESIGDLSDVDLSGIAAGKIIKYDAVLEKWVIADDLGITVETDPIFTDWDKSEGITITESQITDFGDYLEAESDPYFTANFDLGGSTEGDLLRYNGTKWVKYTSNFMTTFTEFADEFLSVAGQTAFELTHPPHENSKVKLFINGVRISNAAYSLIGSTVTYYPENNGSFDLTDGDRVQFDYFY